LTGLGEYAARTRDSFQRHLVVEFLALSWPSLQHRPPSLPAITPDPMPVGSPAEPVFPLRPRTLRQPRGDPPRRLRLPRRGASLLADSLGPARSRPASRAAPPSRLCDQLSQPLT